MKNQDTNESFLEAGWQAKLASKQLARRQQASVAKHGIAKLASWRSWLAAFVAGSLIDLILTYIALDLGLAEEVNPFFSSATIETMAVLKAVSVLSFSAIVYLSQTTNRMAWSTGWALRIVTVLIWITVAWNVLNIAVEVL